MVGFEIRAQTQILPALCCWHSQTISFLREFHKKALWFGSGASRQQIHSWCKRLAAIQFVTTRLEFIRHKTHAGEPWRVCQMKITPLETSIGESNEGALSAPMSPDFHCHCCLHQCPTRMKRQAKKYFLFLWSMQVKHKVAVFSVVHKWEVAAVLQSKMLLRPKKNFATLKIMCTGLPRVGYALLP